MSVGHMIQLDNEGIIGTLMPFQIRKDLTRSLNQDKILKVRDEINTIINSQGWFFQTQVENLNLGDPYIKIESRKYKLRPEWSVSDTFKYWQSHRIDIDCLIMFNLILIYYLKNESQQLEILRPIMDIDISCGLMNTGIHSLVGCSRNDLYPLGDSEFQSQIVNNIPAGCYLYIRGPFGWYDYIYNYTDQNQPILNDVYQGENVISLGNQEFLTFSRDYNGIKFPHPQLVIKSFDYIFQELQKNGYQELSKIYPSNSEIHYFSSNQPFSASKFQVAGIEQVQHLVY